MPQWRHGTGNQRSGGDPLAAYLVYDLFTDTNGTAISAHTPDKAPAGASWADWVGTGFTVQGNRADCNGAADQAVIIESSQADVTVNAGTFIIGANNGILARCTTWQNGILANYDRANQIWVIYSMAGSYTALANYSEAHSAGDSVSDMSLVTSGTSLILRLGGVQRISTTSSVNQAETQCGLLGYGENGTAEWDTFSVQ